MSVDDVDELPEQLRSFLEHMAKINASDLYLIAGHAPVFRVDDVNYPARIALEADDVAAMSESIMIANQREKGDANEEVSVTFPWFADRFRASLFSQRGSPGIVLRRLSRLKTLQELGLGPQLQKLALVSNGLVLVVGGKRSGRSSTLAAMIDHRNATAAGHILTIEDPIEHVHPHKLCVVTQREIGLDTRSYASALSAVAGLAPDLIFIAEIRDAETMDAVLALAEAGYACFSTLHAGGTVQGVERVVSFFPPTRHAEIRARLARSLRAVVAQRLIAAVPEGRSAALEVLLDTPPILDAVRRGDSDAIARLLEQDSALRKQPTHDSGRSAVPLRLAADVRETSIPAQPQGDRRSKVGLPR